MTAPDLSALRPFEPSPQGYQALATLLDAVWPDYPTCAAWLARCDSQRDPAHPLHREVLLDAGRPGALAAVVERSSDPHHPGPSGLVVVAVHPAQARRGLGEALLRHALGALPTARPLTVHCETSEDRPWAARLLERHGFSLALRLVQSELDLATFDPAPFAEAARRVEATGLRLRSLGAEGARDEGLLRAVYAHVAAAVADVPGSGGPMETPFDIWRASYRDNPDLLPEAHLLALEGPRVVGVTQLWASQATGRLLYTGFSGVARERRGLGVATALKAASLDWARRLRGEDGRPPLVRTSNAEQNPMLGINRRLGFVPRAARLHYELRLA